MRYYVPEPFKGPGHYWANQGTKKELSRRKQRLARISSEAHPGNSHFIVFPRHSTVPSGEAIRSSATVGPYKAQAVIEPSPERHGQTLVNQSKTVNSRKDETTAAHAGLAQNDVASPRCLIAGGVPRNST